MANIEKSPATLLDKMAALDPHKRWDVASEPHKVAETFAEVSDRRHTARTHGLPAHFLDSG